MALSLPTQLSIAAVVAGSVAYLVLTDPAQGVLEYHYADAVMSAPKNFEGKEIQVHGTVVEKSLRQKKDTRGDYRFEIQHEGARMSVHYTELLPDTFAEGGEVVLTGSLGADGVFESYEMAAKCPSKYEDENAPTIPGEGMGAKT